MRSRFLYSGLKEATRREGKLNVVARGILAPYWGAAWVLYMIYPDWMARFTLLLPTLTRWVGVGIAVISLPLLLWAQHALGEQYSRVLRLRREHALVTSGPYHWIRHPMYTAGSLFMLGVAVESSNWLVTPAMIAGGILLLTRAGWEESMLLERFGEEYRTYMSHTGRFLPRLKHQE
jgi:protein-S-isoprenylcysteine O-methyltransferase Ste14